MPNASARDRLNQPAVGDAQVVPVRIEDAEVAQPPGLVVKVVVQRPPGRQHPVPLGGDVVHFQHQLQAGWRPPGGTGVGQRVLDRADAHRAAAQLGVRRGLVAAVRGELEAEDALVEVDRDVDVVREDLATQRHVHNRLR
jgi:hypothetical protein